MFTELVRVGCDFQACCGGLVKYQTGIQDQVLSNQDLMGSL